MNMSDIEMQQLRRTILELNETLRGNRQSLSDNTRYVNESSDAVERNRDSVSAHTDLVNAEIAAEKKRNEQKDKRDAQLRKAEYEGEQAIRNFTSALKSNDQTLSKYNSTIGSAGEAVFEFGKGFGVLGLALGGLFKALTAVTGAFLKQADLSLTATDQLSKLGTAGIFSAEEVRQFGNKAGYTADRLDKLVKPIQSLGGALITLGGNAAGGVKAFAAIANLGKDADKTRAHFSAMGITQEELTQAQADYFKLMETSAIRVSGSTEKQQKESLKYVETLSELSYLSGLDLEAAKKKSEAAMSEIQTKLQQNQLNREIGMLEKKAATQELSEQEATRLDILQKQRDNLANVLRTAEVLIDDPKIRAALATSLSTGVSSQANAMFQMLGVPIDKLYDQFQKGENITSEFIQSLFAGSQNMVDTFSPLMGLSPDLMEITNMSGAVLDALAKYGDLPTVEAMLAKRKADIEAGQGGEKDPAQVARSALINAEIALKTGFEDLVASVNPLMMSFDKLNSMIRSLPFMGEDKKPGQEAAETAENMQAWQKKYGPLDESGQAELNQLLAESSEYRTNKEYTDALKDTGYSYDNGFVSPSGKHLSPNDVPENVKKLFNEVYYQRHPGAKPKEVTAKDKGGPIKSGELSIVGEYGPELLTGPGMVTSRQQTADILKDAMQGMPNSQGFSSASIRSQQILIDRKLRDLADEKENELDTLTNLSISMDILNDSAIELSEVFYQIEDQLRSIFGTDEVKIDDEDKTDSFFDKIQNGLTNLFGGGAAAPPVVPSDMSNLKNPEKIKAAMDYFKKQGWSQEQSAGILGNLMAESGRDLRTNAVGDGGAAFGIAQWHPDRQAKFKEVFGKDIRQSTLEEQLAFVNWELKNTERKAGGVLSQTRSGAQAAAMIDKFYERSSGEHRGKRMSYAEGILQMFSEPEVQVAAATATPSAKAEAMAGENKAATTSTTESETKSIPTFTKVDTSPTDMLRINAQLLDNLGSKLDTMIAKLDESNNIQEKIMRQTA